MSDSRLWYQIAKYKIAFFSIKKQSIIEKGEQKKLTKILFYEFLSNLLVKNKSFPHFSIALSIHVDYENDLNSILRSLSGQDIKQKCRKAE